MATINSYLNFPGNTEEAFNFYKSVFGGDFAIVQRFKDAPGHENMSDTDKEKLMHISLPIGPNVLMGTDAVGVMGQGFTVGNNFSLSVSTESQEEAEKIFNGLAAGAEVTMPLQATFWAAAFGMLNDKFGIHWMVNYDGPKK
jgi:PhnB protein